ncbi:MAG: hypothetical protein AABX23_02660 [Nanoarchaeota archaeon]
MTKNKPKDTNSYKGWLNSDSFLKRAFAISGYSFIPVLIFYGIIIILFIIIFLIFLAFNIN